MCEKKANSPVLRHSTDTRPERFMGMDGTRKSRSDGSPMTRSNLKSVIFEEDDASATTSLFNVFLVSAASWSLVGGACTVDADDDDGGVVSKRYMHPTSIIVAKKTATFARFIFEGARCFVKL